MLKEKKLKEDSSKLPSVIKKKKKSKYGFQYNWKPDLPDQRDLLFAKHFAAIAEVPETVDLRHQCSPVFNQGKIGSCTGNAIAGSLEFLELQELKKQSSAEPFIFDSNHFVTISRLFIYYNERLLEGKIEQDSGATLRDGIKTLTKFGACREELCKYLETNVFKEPDETAYHEASQHKIKNYYRLTSLSEIRRSLSAGFPVVFGFSVYESFESTDVARTGIVPMPELNEQLLGGHAVMAVGYDDTTNHLIVRNSWGEDWGDHGYFYLPYEYIESSNLAKDFWTLRN